MIVFWKTEDPSREEVENAIGLECPIDAVCIIYVSNSIWVVQELTSRNFVGDVLAGIWQYMNEPWGGFKELTFDVLIVRAGYNYIGYGRLKKNGAPAPPTPSEAPFSSSRK